MAINDVIERAVPEGFGEEGFKVDLEDHNKNYEIAKQNIGILSPEVRGLEKNLRGTTKYNLEDLKKKVRHTKLPEQDSDFEVILISYAKLKKISYKKIFDQMLKHAEKLSELLDQDKKTKGVRRIDNIVFANAVKKVKDIYDIFIKNEQGYEDKRYAAQHNIKYIITESLEEELRNLYEFTIKNIDISKLATDDILYLTQLKFILGDEKKFVRAYENKLKSTHPDDKDENIIKLKGKAYKTIKTDRLTHQYANIVRKLIQIPELDEDSLGEIDILVSPLTSFEKKRTLLQDHKIIEVPLVDGDVPYLAVKDANEYRNPNDRKDLIKRLEDLKVKYTKGHYSIKIIPQ